VISLLHSYKASFEECKFQGEIVLPKQKTEETEETKKETKEKENKKKKRTKKKTARKDESKLCKLSIRINFATSLSTLCTAVMEDLGGQY
jgi:hypothetical protein